MLIDDLVIYLLGINGVYYVAICVKIYNSLMLL